jgi:hypothetical protein
MNATVPDILNFAALASYDAIDNEPDRLTQAAE